MSAGVTDEIIRKLEAHISSSISFLNTVLQMTDLQPKVVSFDTFQTLTEDSTEVKQNWENMRPIQSEELKCQVRKKQFVEVSIQLLIVFRSTTISVYSIY